MARKPTYIKLLTLIFYVAFLVCVAECTLHAAQYSEVHSMDMKPERWGPSASQVSYNKVVPENQEGYQAGEWKLVSQKRGSKKRLERDDLTKDGRKLKKKVQQVVLDNRERYQAGKLKPAPQNKGSENRLGRDGSMKNGLEKKATKGIFKPPQMHGLRIFSEHRTPFSWNVDSVETTLTNRFDEITGNALGGKDKALCRERTISLIPRFMNIFAYNGGQTFENLREEMLVTLRSILQRPESNGFSQAEECLSHNIYTTIEGAIEDLQFLIGTDSASISKLLKIQDERTKALLSMYQYTVNFGEGTDGIFHRMIELVDHTLGRFVWSYGIEPPHFLMQLDRSNLDLHNKISNGSLWLATMGFDNRMSQEAAHKLGEAVAKRSAHNPLLRQMLDYVSTLTGALAKEDLLRTLEVSRARDEVSSRIAVYFGDLRKQIWLTNFADHEPEKPVESWEAVESAAQQLAAQNIMEWRSYGLQLGTIFDEFRSIC